MGEAVLLPCGLLPWGQTIVGVMATSSKRTYASWASQDSCFQRLWPCTDPEAGHCWPMPLPETPKHSEASLTQSLVGGSFLLGPGVHKVLFVCSSSLFPQSCVGSVIVKFGLELNKVGKTTRPFRYDLNRIPYGCTVEATKRFKGLDLIHRGPEELWTGLWNIAQEAVIKTIPRKRKAARQMVVWGGLKNSWEKKRSERQRRKGKIHPSECRVPKREKPS